ncbi:MAG: serine/threonine protein kinase [Candidatus Hydrogenedentes bacterium]|nr:serine/threonine protein kinase [Candidatus Hydrogenedentota bacterium]
MDRDRDRNLLFGLLAAQLRRVSATSVASATKAWESDRTRDLPDRLVDDGALSEDERSMLLGLVERAIEQPDDEAGATRDALGSITWVETTRAESGSDAPCRSVDSLVTFPAVDECPGRYLPVAEYARGGMGRIVLVRDQHLARDVALKELLPGRKHGRPAPGSAVSPPLAARFVQEARITGRLEHPSIVPIYELGRRADGTLYYTMKLVRGQTLSKAIRSAGSLERRLRLLPHFLDLCQAIAYAHSCGVIHRDIKSENTMVGEFGETVVIDWGLAKSADRNDSQAESINLTGEGDETDSGNGSEIDTTDGKVMGTPVFMAPEQASGHLDKVDERSDIYSLGAVLYELIAGTPPFTGPTSKAVIEKVIRGRYIPIPIIEPAAPAELVAICSRAMQQDREQRYQSSKELAEEISRFLSGALVRSYDYRVREHLKRFARRYRAILLTAAAAALLLAGLGVFYNVRLVESRDEARESRDRAQEYARQADAERNHAEHDNYYTRIALAERSIRESQTDQARKILLDCPVRFRNWEWGRLEQLCDQAYRTLDGHARGVNATSSGPSGSPLVTANQDGTARVWDLATGELTRTLDVKDGELRAAAVSPNGTEVALAGVTGVIRIWDIQSATIVKQLSGHTAPVNALAFSPDGHRLVSAGNDGTARLWDINSDATVRTFQGHLNDVTCAAFSPDGNWLVTGSRDDTAIVWNVETGQVACTFKGHRSDVSSVAFRSDGKLVASGSLDATIKVWSADTAEIISALDEGAPANAVAFSPDGNRLACANANNTVDLWDWRPPASKLRAIQGHAREVRAVAFLDDGHNLVTGSDDGAAKLWNLDEEPGQLRLHQSLMSGQFVKFAAGADGRHIVAADTSGRCVVWDLDSDSPVSQFVTEPAYGMEYNPHSSSMLTVRSDGSISIWDANSGKRLSSVNVALCSVAALNGDGAIAGIGKRDGTLGLYSTATGTEVVALRGHHASVSALAFSKDGALVASGCQDNSVKVWNTTTGQLLYSRTGDAMPEVVAFRPDGAALAIAGAETVIWTLDDSQPPVSFTTNEVNAKTIVSAAFSPDGNRLATGSKDGVVTLWDTESAHELLTLQVCQSYVESLSFNPEGAVLTATGWDQKSGDTLVRWAVKNWNPAAEPSAEIRSGNLRAMLGKMASSALQSPQDDNE